MDLMGWIEMAKDRDAVAGSCEHSNVTSAILRGGKILYKMSDY